MSQARLARATLPVINRRSAASIHRGPFRLRRNTADRSKARRSEVPGRGLRAAGRQSASVWDIAGFIVAHVPCCFRVLQVLQQRRCHTRSGSSVVERIAMLYLSALSYAAVTLIILMQTGLVRL